MKPSTPPQIQPGRWLAWLLDLLYPPHCVVCRRAGAWLCATCLGSMPTFTPPFCAHCGIPLPDAGTSTTALCQSCQNRHSALQGLRSVGPHLSPLREAIHALKYDGVRVLAGPLGALLARTWQQVDVPASTPVKAIIPVPLHRARVRHRGYNQSALLARVLGDELGLPVREDVLVRRRNTRAQVGLDYAARQVNVQDAFICLPHDLAGQRVLLVDDVCTSGATLEACATALLQAGVGEVWALTLTHAVGSIDK